MRVRSYSEGVRERISLLDENLVADTSSGWVKINALFLCESFDVAVLFEVLGLAPIERYWTFSDLF